jgi:hypothetical protein
MSKICNLHPDYEVKGKPTSKKEGCICLEIWEEKKEADRQEAARVKEEEARAKEEAREKKVAEIVKQYADIARVKNSVTMNDMIDSGYSRDTVVHYFRNLQRLNLQARIAHPDSFFDVDINDVRTPERIQKLHDAIDQHKRFIVTTAVTGCQIDTDNLAAMKNYCKRMDAHILVLVASDPAHNKFAPGAKYGTIDLNLIDDDDVSIVFEDIKLNSNLHISTIKLAAKQIDQTTGMIRIAANKGSFIFASPKQRLKAVPAAMGKIPYVVMTTGAITEADYMTDNYMSQRTAWIAGEDHMLGGLILEIEDDDIYYYRQFQNDENGSLIDLGIQYNWDETTEEVSPVLIGGDWHSGSTDPLSIKCKKEMIRQMGIKKFFMHDGFDAVPINGHEEKDVILKAQRAAAGELSLEDALVKFAEDINMLLDEVDELVVVKSNHDDMLDRYLRKGHYTTDHQNHRLALDLAAQLIDGNDPLIYAAGRFGVKDMSRVKWLKLDEDYKIAGIQLGAHGHKGANGARGSLKQMEVCYGQSVTGHAHTPEIIRGAWQTGTSTVLRLSYNSGPSSWMQTDCLVYPNGARQLINIINGKWHMAA